MKTRIQFVLPALILIGFTFMSSCEVDKIISTKEPVQIYTDAEYAVLSASLDLPRIPFVYVSSHPDFDGPGTLGRVLFYDVSLSSDHSVSCASCHQQHLAFADDADFSAGVMDRFTTRNSIALGSLSNFGNYASDPETTLFWDGRVDNLHDQMVQTIRNPNEMGMELTEILNRIKDRDYYKILTQKAFFTDQLSEELMLVALEDFMKSINAFTRFDEVSFKPGNAVDSTDWVGFTPMENMGKSLFQQNCVNCHSQAMSNVTEFVKPLHRANNGLDLVYADKGEGEINPSPDAVGIFKIPGLRNIELTAPYMHDGRFTTLEDVIDFYNNGIQDHPNLHEELKANGVPKKFNFTLSEKVALVQFLKTLTDPKIITEPKWSDPFL